MLKRVQRRPHRRGRLVLALAVAAGVSLLGAQFYATYKAFGPAHRIFALVSDAWLLTPDEVKLISELPQYVPRDEKIAVNPWTGASLAYALAGTKVDMPHLFGTVSKDVKEINRHLRTATPGSAVCRAVTRTHIGYVLDFGSQQVNNAHESYPGIEDLADSRAVALVDRVGDARLYKITACTK
jgi:hypothetical protein